MAEPSHVSRLTDFLNENRSIKEEGFFIVSLDLEIDLLLIEQGVPFVSARDYRTSEALTMTLSETWASSVLESERWSFFSYRGVSLSRLYFLPLQMYLSYLI